MSSSDVTNVTKYFATANEGFTTTLASTIVSGATSVPLNSTTGLTNGNVFVGIIEPGATAQQVFTGTVDVGGAQITNVVWTRGSNTGHAGGVTIVDYSTGTARNMTTTGILKQHTQVGAHTGITTDTISTTGNATVGGTLGVTGAVTHSGAVTNSSTTVLTGAVSGAGYSMLNMVNPYKFSVYRSAAATTGNNAFALITFDTKVFDTGTNYSTGTGLFTAPIAGFYQFNTTVIVTSNVDTSVAFYKNGSIYLQASQGIASSNQISLSGSILIQLAQNDTVSVEAFAATTKSLVIGSSNSGFSGFLVSAT